MYRAWNDFMRGKRKRGDVNEFALNLADNHENLYIDLIQETYTHGAYEEYTICDPKKRVIHKASVRDRVVHRLLYNALYPYFETRFFHDSYSCRKEKGTHKARERFQQFVRQVSNNDTKPCVVLKFDIKKCFASIDLAVLKHLLTAHIVDMKLLKLLDVVIGSFEKGLPLGNLTSQLFVNIYLHEFDHFVKLKLKVRYYLRYADDIVVVHHDRTYLDGVYMQMNSFLSSHLLLTTHKVSIQTLTNGVDVLGEVFFPKYKRLRRSTERRIFLREKLINKKS